MHLLFFSVLLLQAYTFRKTFARPTFVNRIPNGNAVIGVRALGHVNTNGGGPLNVFGMAFEIQGSQWTQELCEADSDGDGATNGQELGDPCCTWTSESGPMPPMAPSSISHPGIPNSFTNEQLLALRCQQNKSTTAPAIPIPPSIPAIPIPPSIPAIPIPPLTPAIPIAPPNGDTPAIPTTPSKKAISNHIPITSSPPSISRIVPKSTSPILHKSAAIQPLYTVRSVVAVINLLAALWMLLQ